MTGPEPAYRCICGARAPDVGLLGDHVLDALADGADPDAHGYQDEPERVVRARQAAAHRAELRARLAAATGLTVAEIREALR